MGTTNNFIWQVRAVSALVAMNARFWLFVLPRAHRELCYWEAQASEIPDPALRAVALEKLHGERFNVEVASTLATIVPRRHRDRAIVAIVALGAMFDYLDGVSEQPSPDSPADGKQLFRAFVDVFEPAPAEAVDYYGRHQHGEDGGYLGALVATCREAFADLPRAAAMAPAARRAAERCGEGQGRAHAIDRCGVAQLAEWAGPEAEGMGLAWWEYAAGAAASVLSMHALIAAAADPRTDGAEADDLDDAYFLGGAVSTLLDSLVDRRRDLEEGEHSFVGYYAGEAERAEGLAAVTARAVAGSRRLRRGSHHYMTTVGIAAYYLSDPEADRPYARGAKAQIKRELRPPLLPILGIFHLWRRAKRLRTARR
jgi:tetraprenyl-beta-curcumene synthase